jgi:hypothetical protein
MTKNGTRKGGLQGLDPAVQQWRDEAAENTAALTQKQRQDRERTRIRYDVEQWLKQAVAAEANRISTSQSQLGTFLLAYSLHLLITGDDDIREAIWRNKQEVNLLQFDYNLAIPKPIERDILAHQADQQSQRA